MANDYDLDLDDDTGIGDLRKAYRKAQARIKELESDNNTLRTQGRERTVKDVLAAKGVTNPAKIAKLIPADVADEAAVEGWLTEYADVFNIAVSDSGEDTEAAGPDPQQVQALADINGASTGGGLPTSPQDLEARIRAASSPEELQQIVAQAQLG